MLVGLPTAQAAEVSGTLNSILCGLSNYFCHGTRPETLVLACEGTVTDVSDDKSKPIARVVTVNFKTQTVRGFDTGGPLPITGEDSMTIFFYEEVDRGLGPIVHLDWIEDTNGNINRLTGVLSAEEKRWKRTGSKSDISNLLLWRQYFLKCRPAQRMF
jgi:hypothetical protein